MGNWGRVNIGSGGGKLFAIIAVTYPAGSTCTCTNGKKTLTTKDTSGKVLFNVPSAGTWVVSCTNGTKTASKTVSITAERQGESVKLTYTYLSIFKEGTGAVQTLTTAKQTYSSIFVNTSGITFSYSSGNDSAVIAVTKEKVDLTEYKTLHVEANISALLNTNWRTIFGVFSANTLTLQGPTGDAISYITPEASSTRKEYTVDVSELTTSGYVGLYGVGTGTVYNIWLD